MGTLQGELMTETLERERVKAPGKKQRWGWVLAVLLLGALALTVSGILPFRQLISQQNQIERSQEQLTALRDENDALAEDIEMLGTDAEIERLAREQFGLVRPGEVAYVVVTPDEPLAIETAPDPVVRSDERPWWKRVWGFVTGSDVDPDG
jgi:cell division protein FtsB